MKNKLRDILIWCNLIQPTFEDFERRRGCGVDLDAPIKRVRIETGKDGKLVKHVSIPTTPSASFVPMPLEPIIDHTDYRVTHKVEEHYIPQYDNF